MEKLKTETRSTFENKSFEKVAIPVKRQDGLNSTFHLYIDEHKNTLLVVNNDNDVLLKIIGDGFTVV